MPPNLPIYRIFGQSPFGPMQTHMQKVHSAAMELLNFFDAVEAADWSKVESSQQKIVKMEQEADVLKKEVRLNLPKGLFMPVARTDLLEMLTRQDKIANKAKDIAGLMLGRKMQLPANLVQDFKSLLGRCLDAATQAFKAIGELDELVETGFRGHEAEVVSDMINQLDEIERDTDDIQIQVRKKLFEIEKELPPVEVMFLYKIIEWTGDLADRAEHVGSQLQLLLAR